MESIKIPSPSVILGDPPPLPSTSPPSVAKKPAAQNAVNPATNKPKQSKSRNGCITCKTKRLKCDESKPTCLQCKKRNVECGGYKKDFKWRPFEESNLVFKATTGKTKKVSSSPPLPSAAVSDNNRIGANPPPPAATEHSVSPTLKKSSLMTVNPLRYDGSEINGSPPTPSSFPPRAFPSSRQSNQMPITRRHLSIGGDELPGGLGINCFDEANSLPSVTEFSPPDPSPWLSDLLLSAGDFDSHMDQRAAFGISLEDSPSKSDNFSFSDLLEGDNEDLEEIVQQTDPSVKSWMLQLAGRSPSAQPDGDDPFTMLLKEPKLGMASPEMLILRYDRFTCGIMSVKDGANENPWRTLIWPLAKDSPALYHAIFAMASFHSCKEDPSFRVHGVDHMRQSITFMVQDIENMRTDAALATSLALAFADTWDQHTKTCIQHLKGAKALVSQVLKFGIQNGMRGADLERVRFLYNTWLYMDVIARLTSRDEVGEVADCSIFHLPKDAVHEIDPLMGCATTLFPIINRVARLIQQVRKCDSNSLSVVSQAIELKGLLERWEPPRWFEPPEDPTSEVQHSIQTAHAYRWATLLYLHQAVPEMPSEPDSELAKRVLILLATVPPSSRTTIIQMFPLLAAGSEAEQDEDREWVLERWMAIQARLMLGGIDRCVDVVREVWKRRDAYKVDQQRRPSRGSAHSGSGSGPGPFGGMESSGKSRFSHRASGSDASSPNSGLYHVAEPWRRRSTAEERTVSSSMVSSGGPRRGSAVSPLENIAFDKTVRGKLHWVNVMESWGWEVFLG